MDEHTKQLLALAREHYEQNEYEKAEYLLGQVVAKTDRFADVFNMLGVIAHGKGDFEQAQRHFERAVELNPNYTEARLNLLVVYNDLGQYEAARKLHAALREGGAREQGDAFAKGKIANMHAETAQAYVDIGLFGEGIVELEKAVALRPAFLDLRTKLAALYRDSGDLRRAKDHLRAATEIDSKFLPARVAYAGVLLQEGFVTAAKRELEEILELKPDHRVAQMYLRMATLSESKRGGQSG